MTDEEFNQKLREVCRAYDRKWGQYPESKYEGWALYMWTITGEENWQTERSCPEDWSDE